VISINPCVKESLSNYSPSCKWICSLERFNNFHHYKSFSKNIVFWGPQESRGRADFLKDCYRYRPVTIPLPFGGHHSPTFHNLIDRYSTFINVIGRYLTLPQRDPLFTTNIRLNMSLMGHVEVRLRNVE
jgi:hypothetical protein